MTPAEKLLQKSLVTSGLDSRQWNQVQAGLRDRAFFSSRVESATFLHATRGMAALVADGQLSESEMRRNLREILRDEGYQPKAGEAGTLKDLFSRKRLDVIIDTNVRQAQGYVRQLESTTPGALAAFPAQELVRVRHSKSPRNDWPQRWEDAGGKFYAGRMCALKNDPVWINISRFDVPWPPFDFGSGMGAEELSREAAVELGIMSENDPPPSPPVVLGFNENLEAEVPFGGRTDPEWLWLKESFGDQIVYRDNKVRWQMGLIHDIFNGKTTKSISLGKATAALRERAPESLRSALENTSLSITKDLVVHLDKSDHYLSDAREGNMPVMEEDLDLLPSVWRAPDVVTQGARKDSAVLEFDTFDEGILVLVVDLRNGALANTLYKKRQP